MRRILADHARIRDAAKRGGGTPRLTFDEAVRLPSEKDPDLVALDDALESLARVDPRQARIVEQRFFAGLTIDEIAELEGLSPTTIKRYWQTARLWLLRELSETSESG